MAIEKIIHGLWLGSEIPNWGIKNLHTWKQKHPDWEISLWNDARLNEAKGTLTEAELAIFDLLPKGVLQSTIIRFSILRTYGGIYVDLDFPCLEAFLHLIPEQVGFGCGQKPGGGDECALLISAKNEPFLTWQIERSLEFWRDLDSELRSSLDRMRVVWPFNDFDRRVPKFFEGEGQVEILKEDRRGTWGILQSRLLRICASRLHGGPGAFAWHEYKHTWWQKARRANHQQVKRDRELSIVLHGYRDEDKGAEAGLKATMFALGARLPCHFYISRSSTEFGTHPDVILDLGGSAHSEAGGCYGWEHSCLTKAKNPGTPWIFMPRSYGSLTRGIDDCRVLFRGELLYATDLRSIELLKEIDQNVDCRYAHEVAWEFRPENARVQGEKLLGEHGLQLNRPKIGISLDEGFFGKGCCDELSELKSLVQNTRHAYEYVILPQVTSSEEQERENELASMLEIYRLPPSVTAEDWAGTIACMDVVISSRSNTSITALSAAVPVLNIDQSIESRKMMCEFQLSDFLLDKGANWQLALSRIVSDHSRLAMSISAIVERRRFAIDGFFNEVAAAISDFASEQNSRPRSGT